VTRQHPIRDAGLALSLLTIVPTPARWPQDGQTQVAGWFPAVGGLIGLAGYTVVKLAELGGALDKAPYLVAAVVVVIWAVLTRLLHWDGLADVADGYWGSHDQQQRLEIMSDSRTGAFGSAAVALVAILEVAAMGAMLSYHEFPVLAIPIFARFAATAAAWFGTPARPGGLGRSVMGRPSLFAVLACASVVGTASYGLWRGHGLLSAVLAAVGFLLALAVPHLLAQRFGGVTGDVMGASVLITETLMFLAAFVLR
jgi:adenosylcobinamide-GDP ribazoletransferase